MRKLDEIERIDIIAEQLYRLVEELESVYSDKQTMICWVLQAADLLTEVYNQFCYEEQYT